MKTQTEFKPSFAKIWNCTFKVSGKEKKGIAILDEELIYVFERGNEKGWQEKEISDLKLFPFVWPNHT